MARQELGQSFGKDFRANVGEAKRFSNADVKIISEFKQPTLSPEPGRGFSKDVKVKVGSTEYLGNVEVKAVNGFKKSRLSQKQPSSVGDHEATHAALLILRGKRVKKATVIPEGDSLGSVESDVFDEVAAVGPHAKGSSGTGWDIFLVKRRGSSVDNAISAAKDLINKNDDKIRAVGNALDENKTMTHYDIKKVMDQVDEDKNKPPNADILVTDIYGGQREIKDVSVSPEGFVSVPVDLVAGKWTTIPGRKPAAA